MTGRASTSCSRRVDPSRRAMSDKTGQIAKRSRQPRAKRAEHRLNFGRRRAPAGSRRAIRAALPGSASPNWKTRTAASRTLSRARSELGQITRRRQRALFMRPTMEGLTLGEAQRGSSPDDGCRPDPHDRWDASRRRGRCSEDHNTRARTAPAVAVRNDRSAVWRRCDLQSGRDGAVVGDCISGWVRVQSLLGST